MILERNNKLKTGYTMDITKMIEALTSHIHFLIILKKNTTDKRELYLVGLRLGHARSSLTNFRRSVNLNYRSVKI